MRRSSETAVALIMTLIMLSVITVVSVAFLALTQRERTSVSQSSQQTESEWMANEGYEHAKGSIISLILASNNLLEADMVVSTNYINVNGFDPTQGTNLFNVNFDHRVNNGGSLSLNDLQQNIANLLYYPRAPVFVNTNTPGQPEGLEFRFY